MVKKLAGLLNEQQPSLLDADNPSFFNIEINRD